MAISSTKGVPTVYQPKPLVAVAGTQPVRSLGLTHKSEPVTIYVGNANLVAIIANLTSRIVALEAK